MPGNITVLVTYMLYPAHEVHISRSEFCCSLLAHMASFFTTPELSNRPKNQK